MVQMTAMKRSPSPSTLITQPRATSQNPAQPQPTNINRVPSGMTNKQPIRPPSNLNTGIAGMRSSQQTTNSTTNIDGNEPSLDIFDSFSDFEVAFYRLNTIKPFFNRLLEQSTIISNYSSSLPEGLETDLINAARKKISSINERSEKFKNNHQESLQDFKSKQKLFWESLTQLETSSNPIENYNKFKQFQDHSMNQEYESSYTSL